MPNFDQPPVASKRTRPGKAGLTSPARTSPGAIADAASGALGIAQEQAIYLAHPRQTELPAETTRVNARVDAATSRKLSEIMFASGLNVTETLRHAIDALHEQKGLAKRDATPRLDALTGAYDSAQTDNSVHYKAIIADAMAAKFARVFSGEVSKTVPRRAVARA